MNQEALLNLIEQAAREGWKDLNLSEKSISKLPLEIGQLTNLQILDLSYNGLTTLPKAIGQLTNLQQLDLSLNFAH
jgi:Leucine-rich repeat (LRR) protein